MRSPRATSARHAARSSPSGVTPSISNVIRPLIQRIAETRSTSSPRSSACCSASSGPTQPRNSSPACDGATISASLLRSRACASPSMLLSADGPRNSVMVADRLPLPFFVKMSSLTRTSCATSASLTTSPNPGTFKTGESRRARSASGQPTGWAAKFTRRSCHDAAKVIGYPRSADGIRGSGTSGAC